MGKHPMQDGRNLFIDVESTTCAVGIVVTYVDEQTSGITLFRGNKEAIGAKITELVKDDNVAAAIAYVEETNDIHHSESAYILAQLAKLFFATKEEEESRSETLNDLLKSIIKN